MEILKINTGLYNLLLIETPIDVYYEVELDKTDKLLHIKTDDNVDTVDLNFYLDEDSRGVKLIGTQDNMREKHFRSLLILPEDGDGWDNLFFTKEFEQLLVDEGWTVDKRQTLIVRI